MTTKVWQISLDGKVHEIKLEHGYFSGKRVILLDGIEIYSGSRFIDYCGMYPFTIDNIPCSVRIQTNGITFTYDLFVRDIPYKTD